MPPSHFQTFRHLCIRQLTCYVIQGCGLYPYCNNYYPFYAVVTIHLPLADCDFLYLLIKLIAEKMSSKRKSVKDKKERKQVNYFLNFPVAIVISSKSLGFCNKKMSVYRQSVRMHLLVRLPFFCWRRLMILYKKSGLLLRPEMEMLNNDNKRYRQRPLSTYFIFQSEFRSERRPALPNNNLWVLSFYRSKTILVRSKKQ